MVRIAGRQKGILIGIAVFLAVLLGAPCVARAAWTNGQAATLVLGQSDFTSSEFATTQSGFWGAIAVCVDKSSGKAFVADYSNNRILRFSSTAAATNGANAEAAFGQSSYELAVWGRSKATLFWPAACSLSDSGDLWVADSKNQRILLYANAANKPEFNAEPDKVLGQADYVSASSTVNSATLAGEVSSVLVSPDGSTVWASDRTANRVLRWDNVSAKLNGAAADSVLGQADFVSNGSGVSATQLSGPNGLALSAAGALYVYDAINNRALRFDNAASLAPGAAASGVLGAADFVSVGSGAATVSTFGTGIGLAIGTDQRLYLADTSHRRVLIFNSPASKANGADADYVLGQTDFTSTVSSTTAATFTFPAGLSANPLNGVLYLADFNNSRVLGFYNEELIPRTLTVSPSADGTVSADSGAISACSSTGGTCSGEYAYGATVTLTAVPDPGYATTWTSGCFSYSGNGCTVSNVRVNTSVSVSFALTPVPAAPAFGYLGYGLALLGLAALALRAGQRRAR